MSKTGPEYRKDIEDLLFAQIRKQTLKPTGFRLSDFGIDVIGGDE
jgi:hypothetical protein